MRVAEGVQGVVADEHHGVAALEHAHGVRDARAQAVAALGKEANELGRHLGVGVGAERDAHLDELVAQAVEVHERAVVRQCDDHVVDHREVRLRGLPALGAGGAVAAVAAGDLAGHGREVGVGKDLRDEAEVLAHKDRLAVADRDAGRVLAAVLQRVQREVGHAGHIVTRGPYAKDAALLMELVVLLLGRGTT